ncbi:AraC family transcriptional regulator [Gillisia sp. Hel_I_29]|uniref:AraC family transcriptional regulator n=1 Tax=Gillisia sp. Hel_I_29 TaxID=1249975 RepID=UPI0009DDD30A|nr:AraC family transcriptional regulator [Gillisia sp. Hel_I_29]
MRFYCLFFLFLYVNISHGQDRLQYDDYTFGVLMDSIKSNYGKPEQQRIFTTAYISKAKKLNNKKEEFNGLYYQIYALLLHRELAEAEKKYSALLDFVNKNDLKEQTIFTYDLGGEIQKQVPNFSLAIERFNAALHLAEALNNTQYRDIALINISNLLNETGDYAGALKIRKKIIALYEKKPLDSNYTKAQKSGTLAYGYFLLFNSYLKNNKLDSAKYYNQKIKEIVRTADSCYVMYLYNTNAEIALQNNNFKAARNFYKRYYNTCPIGLPIADLRKAHFFGRVEMKAKNYNEAITIFEKGLVDYEVSPQEEGFMGDYYRLMTNAYKETGDFEKAGYYFEKHLVTADDANKMKNDVVRASKQQELKAFKEELVLLKKEKDSRTKFLIYILLGASIVILFLLFFLLKFYRTKRANEIKFEALLEKMKTLPQDDHVIIDTKDEILEAKNSTDVPEEIKQQILMGLKKLETQEYYLKQECNSYNVAKKINTNTSYLSKVINNHYQKNFNTYINDLRINYTIVRLKNDTVFRSYSIQAIAEEVGYKSADSFSKYFKKDTGLNPSFYIKELKNIT